MKRTGQWLLSLLGKALILLLLIVLLPYAFRFSERIFPDITGDIQTESMVLMRELRASSRLETATVDEEGVIDSKTSVILLGTVGKTTIHYRYRASIGIDLSKVQLKIKGKRITFIIPPLEILQDSIEKTDVHQSNFLSHAIDKDIDTLLDEQLSESRKYYLSQNEHSASVWEDTKQAFENTIAKWISTAGNSSYEFEYLKADEKESP